MLLGAAVCQPRPAAADADYPNRPIRLIVPYAPGGVPDTSARLLAQKLQSRIGQSVFVENRPGGNGGVAAAVINTSPADGYTLMVVDTTLLSVGPIFLNDLSFDPKKDFVPIAALARTPVFLAVNAQMPIKTLDEFVTYVRAHPGQLNYGSAGVGSTHQLTMEAMKAALHLDIVHVPYHGTGEAVPALLGNHVQALWAAYPSLKGAVERGDIRLLAHNGLGHSPLLPELPPLADLDSRLRHGHEHWRLRPRRNTGQHRSQNRCRLQCGRKGKRHGLAIGFARHGAGGRGTGSVRENDPARGRHHHPGGRERRT